MPNELIWILFALVNFSLLLLFYRLFGRTGLYVWIGMATVIANIQVLKTVDLIGLTATLGNILYGTAYLATDIINEKHGKKEAKKAVWLGFATLVTMTIIMQIALAFEPGAEDIAHDALATIFSLIPRIVAGSLAAYMISQYFDVWIYDKLRNLFPSDRQLWIRNNGSTVISQFVDTIVFCTIAFYGTYPFDIWLEIFITTYVIKFAVAIIDTPFMYIAKNMHVEKSNSTN
ncbi:MAG: queuosine precursor transporter [Bacillota bacterium]|uniref:Probable queuosine precursor transporter n=1 Tax=Virgibacillus salarius TaxID=447199 RepID=A0A941DW44_9BACI|nr:MULTISPECIES: queuosine precursor transporter [Bacillaceae]NAZ09276.1 queuosine precursor transporter [Agaribacter marinus]MBR7796567.1 queuosine precursor transporter [Virgibacillus salarius]MCC2250892.1 queuosine precursor transporter [Virgibacillus sp. AGTR]MDY7042598.1 queuosine precursor transporter [Virgibacillus sp. M23]QRZ17067.1 queuosine precursor transporter [Virgibacillus sp. AGTR]